MANFLVIDDEDLVRLTVRQTLEKLGHTVEEARDGKDGMEKFRTLPVDVVITDIIMPNKEGLETIQELREVRPDVIIIAISGGGRMKSTSFLNVAKNLGANAVMKKPFAIDEFCRVVNQCLDDRQDGHNAASC